MSTTSDAVQKVKYACAYARHGFRVFPLHWITDKGECSCRDPDYVAMIYGRPRNRVKVQNPGEPCPHPAKHPLYKGWKDSATCDESTIGRIWKQTPNANIGVCCGGNVTVVDVDGAVGLNRWAELQAVNGPIPPTPTVRTGSGGLHLYFQFESETRNSVRWDGGLDIRTKGGQVVGVGSSTDKGAYTWLEGLDPGKLPLSKMPAWLLEAILAGQEAFREIDKTSGRKGFRLPDEKVQEGEGRNTTIYSYCRSLKARNTSETAIRAAAIAVNKAQCSPPLDDGELEQVINNALTQPDRPGFGKQRKKPSAEKEAGLQHPYIVHEGVFAISHGVDEEGKEDIKHIATFRGEIPVHRQLDDGVEVKHEYEISLTRDKVGTVTFTVPAEQYNSYDAARWIPAKAGLKFRPLPGMTAHVLGALDELSTNTENRTVYLHTGWKKVNGVYRYLHRGLADVELQLDKRLSPFILPPVDDDLKTVVRAFLRLREIGPDELMIPLLAAVVYSVLGLEADFAEAIVGRTGTFNTAVAALLQQCFGPGFDALHLPAHFLSTAGSIEERIFQIKDAVGVIDDFRPSGTAQDRARMRRDLDRIVFGISYQDGRGRLTKDIKQRPVRVPRCIVVITAEEEATGDSLVGRLLDVHVKAGDISKDKLTAAQADAAADRYAAATAGYINYLIPQLEAVQRGARLKREEAFRRFLAETAGSEMHNRLPVIFSRLYAGWELYLDYAGDIGALSNAERSALLAIGWAALKTAASRHARYQREQNPVQIFLAALRSALLSRQAHIAARDGAVPIFGLDDLTQPLGWTLRTFGKENMEWIPHGDRIGWLDMNDGQPDVYLKDLTAYKVASKALPNGMPISLETLKSRLKEAGLLVKTSDRGGRPYEVQRTIEGKRGEDVLYLKTGALFPPAEDGRPIGTHGLVLKPQQSKLATELEPKEINSVLDLAAQEDERSAHGGF